MAPDPKRRCGVNGGRLIDLKVSLDDIPFIENRVHLIYSMIAL